jgi:hypothetical protein
MSFLWCPTLTGEQPKRAQKAAIRIGDYDREIMTPEARRTGETASTSRSAPPKVLPSYSPSRDQTIPMDESEGRTSSAIPAATSRRGRVRK